MRTLLLSVLMASCTSLAAGMDTPDTFNSIFTKTCMKHFYSMETLKSEMASTPRLSTEDASYFLGGIEGVAWPISADGEKYVLSIRSDGICAVFANKADIALVTRNFINSVSTAPTPLVSERKQNFGPSRPGVATTSFSWHQEKDDSELLFTLTTSGSPNSAVQAMASLGLAKKSPQQQR